MKEPAPRRRAERLSVDLPARLTGRTSRDVVIKDLSLGGCLADGDQMLEPGSIFDLAGALPGGELKGKVRVVECSLDGASPAEAPRYLLGLEFLGLLRAEEERLRRFMADERRRRGARATPA